MVRWGSDDCPTSLLSASAPIALFLVPGTVGSGYGKEAFKELTCGCGRRADCTGRGPRASDSGGSARGVEITGGGSDRGVGVGGVVVSVVAANAAVLAVAEEAAAAQSTVAAAHAAAASAVATAHAAVLKVGEPERSSSC